MHCSCFVGLYDSVPLSALSERPIDYAALEPIWDLQQLQAMLADIAKTGRSIEAAFNGAPQDIEGVWADGKITIVQSRAQVL